MPTFNFAKNTDRFEPITWKAMKAEFAPRFQKPFANSVDELKEIVVFRGNVRIDGDLVIDARSPNVIVDGNIVVDGSLVMSVREGIGQFMLVTGNVAAESVCLSGFPELVVRGHVKSANGIVGIHGDDGGYFDVLGDVKAPVLIADTYFNVNVKGAIKAVTINTSERRFKAQYTFKNVHEIVSREFLEREDGDVIGLKSEKVFKAVRAGKSVLT